jgi:hypothetical protein
MATVKRIFIIALLFLVPALAEADSVWTFEGNLTDPGTWHGGQPVTHCNCDLDGTILFDDNFKVLAYSFTDGTHTLNNQNSTSVFNLQVGGGTFNGGGTFTVPLGIWSIEVTGGDVLFHTDYFGPTQGAVNMNYVDVGNQLFGFGQANSGQNGSWTEVVSTPEPGSLLLLGAGITALALAISLRNSLA